MFLTYRYRIKDSSIDNRLTAMSRSVNTVWNFCNEVQISALRWGKTWPTHFDLNRLCSGSSKQLGIHSQTVQAVCEQYARSRQQHRKAKLRWRGVRSLAWVPFSQNALRVDAPGNYRYLGLKIKTWHSRDLPVDAKIKSGSICQDSTGRWYLNITFEMPDAQRTMASGEIGIDLGLKALASYSTGAALPQSRFYRDLEGKLGIAQRARKKFATSTIHRKIRSRRRDAIHKATTALVKHNGLIVVGNINASAIAKTKMAKSSLDASWSSFRDMLRYKAMTHGTIFLEVNESFSTQTCSCCGAIPASSPKGRACLGIREWTCDDCGAEHQRDVNAARNILAAGHRRLAVGN